MRREQVTGFFSQQGTLSLYKHVVFIASFFTLSYAQIVQTLQIDFEKTTVKNEEKEHVCGTIFYRQPDAVCMIINHPANQWIFSGEDSMVFFYPDDSLAFKFQTMYPVRFTFFQAFLGIVQEDYGLTALGYALAAHEVHDSILTTTWTPPEEAPDDAGLFHITYANGKLKSAAYESMDGTIISRTHYRDHYVYGAYFFPMEIEKIQYAQQDTIRETITYANPEFNCALPDSLMNFRLPEYVTTNYIQW